MAQVTSEELEQNKCYGTKRIIAGKDACPRRSECPWGDACASRAGEEAADRHYHKANVSCAMMVFDHSDDPAPGQRPHLCESVETEIMSLQTDKDELANGRVAYTIGSVEVTESEYAVVIRVLSELVKVRTESPTVFNALFDKIQCDTQNIKWNQSIFSHSLGITRQGGNKRLMSELGLAQKRKDKHLMMQQELARQKESFAAAEEQFKQHCASLRKMTDAEYRIYKTCAEDGVLSATAISQITGLSRKTIYKTIHSLYSKYGIRVTLHPYAGRKKKK